MNCSSVVKLQDVHHSQEHYFSELNLIFKNLMKQACSISAPKNNMIQDSFHQTFFSSKNESAKPFFSPLIFQPKLQIGQVDDIYEKEADRVADKVMKMPEAAIQKFDDEEELQMKTESGIQMMCDGCREEEEVQRKPLIGAKAENSRAASPELSRKINSAKSTGYSLPQNTAKEMGSKIGADFREVRIHTDSHAVQMNRELGAR
ncbi:MAG: DUF4157 domain-containing protein, partial [Balneolaceae bacterium]